MSRSERWNTDSEIKRRLNNTTDSKVGADLYCITRMAINTLTTENRI